MTQVYCRRRKFTADAAQQQLLRPVRALLDRRPRLQPCKCNPTHRISASRASRAPAAARAWCEVGQEADRAGDGRFQWNSCFFEEPGGEEINAIQGGQRSLHSLQIARVTRQDDAGGHSRVQIASDMWGYGQRSPLVAYTALTVHAPLDRRMSPLACRRRPRQLAAIKLQPPAHGTTPPLSLNATASQTPSYNA